MAKVEQGDLRAALAAKIEEWRKGERNCNYGFDETGNRIPLYDGNQCATELESLLAAHAQQGTETHKEAFDRGYRTGFAERGMPEYAPSVTDAELRAKLKAMESLMEREQGGRP